LQRLADGEALQADDVADIDPDDLMEWLENGWVWLDYAE
jgi:50S ribosomal protein L16 3-hydroxylase